MHEDRLASLRRRAAWARVLAIVYAVIAMVGVLLKAYQVFVERQIMVNIPAAPIMLLYSLISLPFFLASALALMLWIYRARKNLIEFGVDDLRHSPGWAVGSYFVPFVNLVTPFRSMRELWNRSHGEDAWQADLGVGDVSGWWSCFIAANFITFVLGLMGALQAGRNFYFVTPPGVNSALIAFSNMLIFGSAIYLFRVIGGITRAQQGWKGVSQLFA